MAGDLTAGTLFSGYRIESLIGRGGMGVVYRATELSAARPAALKLIVPEFAADLTFRRRFEREARLAAEIRHPNVIPVYEAGESDGQLFIASRYVEGTDLGALIASEGGLHPRHAAAILVQVASALDAAHAQDLVHRDVKPSNVLLEERHGGLHAYLTDFGLSKMTTSKSGLTKTGLWVGTAEYAAPEQLQAGQTDARTDVYALGCVLFESVSGQVPFPKAREVLKIIAHLTEAPAQIAEVAPSCPAAEALDDVVQKAMAKQPGDRFRSAGELATALEAAVDGAPPPPHKLRIRGTDDAVDRSAPTAG
jgi:serine/threonine protein kinase